MKKGWGIYCSVKCKSIGTSIRRQKTHCFICRKEILRTNIQMNHSKSGKFFCNKSCQTKWRNAQFIGEKHSNFRNGETVYQTILKRNKVLRICSYCGERDIRVLATHHVDGNRKNNNIKNLTWLCHNCHSLVHCDRLEGQKFLINHIKKLR
ncbi:MAG: HNH endonuclease [bacterium]